MLSFTLLLFNPLRSQISNDGCKKKVKKESNKLIKEGWYSMIKPIADQLILKCNYADELDINGMPKYYVVTERSVGATEFSAKIQAIETAKLSLAGMIISEITSQIPIYDSTCENKSAISITEAILIAKLNTACQFDFAVPVVEIYRLTSDKYFECEITLIYEHELTIRIGKEAIKKELIDEY
jgi:hypothetical protein